jgi:uncharacterized protein (DUF58 family)
MKPTTLFLQLLGTLFAAAVLLGALPALGRELPASLTTLWWSLLLALGLLALLDAGLLRRQSSPHLMRRVQGNLPLDRWSEVQLVVNHGFSRSLRVQLFDHVPGQMVFEHLPQTARLKPGQHTSLTYRLRPLQRGHFRFDHCELALPSPLRLWQARRLVPLVDETRVYPDFARLYGAQLMAVEQWVNHLGIRQQPRRGLGLEFHQLREFREGDSLRQIDWKATARQRTPIAREYQDERDQQILFLLDCGRRMRSHDGDLAHFDHALNACLLLSHVALRQGDAVGLSTFASEQPRFLAPSKGLGQLKRLLNTVYNLQSSPRPADFLAAADNLLARQPRRALVVLVSNLRDEDDDQLLTAVKRLGRRHRVMIASLREEVLDELKRQPVENYTQALTYCGALDYLNTRAALHERLGQQGVPVLDVRPGELGPALVSRYLAWKKAGAL